MSLFNVLFDIAAKTASFDASMARIESQFTRIGQVAREAGQFIGVSLSISSIVEFTNRAIDAGDEVYRLSQKAGTTAAAFSELSFAARSSGVDVGSLSAAFGRMENVISKAQSGDYSMRYLFEEIGVSVKALASLSPDKQFELIAQAISLLSDPADRARAAIAVFGRAGAEMLPLLTQGASGIEKLKTQSDQLGVTLNDLSAKQLHDTKSAIDAMDQSFNAMWLTIASKLSPALTAIADGIRKTAGGSTDIEKLQQQIQAMTIAQGEAAQNRDFDSVAAYQKAIDAVQAQISAAQAQIASSSTPADVKAGLAKALGFSPDTLDEIGSIAKRLPEYQKNNPLTEFYEQINTDTDSEQEKLLKKTQDFYARIGVLVSSGTISGAEGASRLNTFLYGDPQQIAKLDEVTGIGKRMADLQTDAQKMAIAMRDSVTQASQDMSKGFYQFFLNPADVGIKGLALDFVNAIEQMIAKQATLTLFGTDNTSGPLGGLFASIFGALGGTSGSDAELSAISASFGGALSPFAALAGGGPAVGGRTYLVGEEGPELFTPGASGVVTPNASLGGGGDIHITNNVDARGATVDAIQLLPSAMKQASDSAVSRIVDMRRRGQI